MKKTVNKKSMNKQHTGKYKKTLRFITAIFITALFLFNFLFFFIIKSEKKTDRERIQYITDSQVNKLKATISKYMNITKTWEMLVVETNGNIEDFEELSAKFYEYDATVRSIQLAPNGVITQIYPLEGNEDAFGDLFSDPDRKTEAEYARDTGKMTLAGPFELYQGGLGIVVRQPVYLEDDKGQPVFWGFTIVVLNMEEMFKTAELQELHSVGYEYKLWRVHPDTGEVQIILESSDEKLENPTQMSFEVPNSVWTFDVAPTGGWVNYKQCAFYFLTAVLLSFLLMLISWLIIHLKHQKEQLAVLSYTDSLTNLFNLRKLMEVIKKHDKSKTPFGITFMDLNGFKQVNDAYGHDVGDQLLIMTAYRLSDVCPEHKKMVFRIGGDEFIILLEGDYEEEFYYELIEQIKQSLLQDVKLGSITLNIKTSAGFARFPHDAPEAENIIKIADRKMYEEKQSFNN